MGWGGIELVLYGTVDCYRGSALWHGGLVELVLFDGVGRYRISAYGRVGWYGVSAV